jgi:hypothetical protein
MNKLAGTTRAAALTLLFLLVLSTFGRAAEPRQVVTLVGPRDAPVTLRLRTELETSGFTVRVQSEDPGNEPAADVSAVVRVRAASRQVEVWTVPSGQVDMITARTAGAGWEDDVAVRVTEVLRARLLRVEREDAGSPPGAPPPTPVPSSSSPPSSTPPAIASAPPALPSPPETHSTAATPPSAPADAGPPPEGGRGATESGPHWLVLDLGAGVLGSPGGAGPSFDLRSGVRFRFSRRFEAEAFGWIPMLPAAVTGPEGSARLFASLVGAGLRLDFADPRARWQPALGAGGLGAFLYMRGNASPGYESSSDDVQSFGGYASASLAYAPWSTVRVALEAFGGVLAPETVVRFAGRDAATFRTPAGGALTVEATPW